MKIETRNRRDRRAVSHYFLGFRELVRRTKTRAAGNAARFAGLISSLPRAAATAGGEAKAGRVGIQREILSGLFDGGRRVSRDFSRSSEVLQRQGHRRWGGIVALARSGSGRHLERARSGEKYRRNSCRAAKILFSARIAWSTIPTGKKNCETWISKVKHAGFVFLYLPHPDCGIWEVGSPFVGGDHKWTPTPAIIREGARTESLQGDRTGRWSGRDVQLLALWTEGSRIEEQHEKSARPGRSASFVFAIRRTLPAVSKRLNSANCTRCSIRAEYWRAGTGEAWPHPNADGEVIEMGVYRGGSAAAIGLDVEARWTRTRGTSLRHVRRHASDDRTGYARRVRFFGYECRAVC